MVPFIKSEFGSTILISGNASSKWRLRFLLFSLAALLSTARNWAREGALFFCFKASQFLLLEPKQKNHDQNLNLLLVFKSSVLVSLRDLLDSSTVLETPIRLPSVVLWSRKKDPVDWIKTDTHVTFSNICSKLNLLKPNPLHSYYVIWIRSI